MVFFNWPCSGRNAVELFRLFPQFCAADMVQLHVKRGDDSQFLFNTTVDVSVDALVQQVAAIYNGRLKVDRICSGEVFTKIICFVLWNLCLRCIV